MANSVDSDQISLFAFHLQILPKLLMHQKFYSIQFFLNQIFSFVPLQKLLLNI